MSTYITLVNGQLMTDLFVKLTDTSVLDSNSSHPYRYWKGIS